MFVAACLSVLFNVQIRSCFNRVTIETNRKKKKEKERWNSNVAERVHPAHLSLSLSESSPFHSRSRSSFHLVQFSVLHSSPDPNPALADPRRRLISSAAISSPHFPALKALVENCFEEHITSVIAPCFAPQVRLNCAFTWHRVKSSDCRRLGIVSKKSLKRFELHEKCYSDRKNTDYL